LSIAACVIRIRYVLVFGIDAKRFVPVTHLDQGGVFWDSDPWRSGAPHNLRYQTMSNRVSQNRWFSVCCPLTL